MLKAASLFSQILGEISRIDFQKLVIKHGVERHADRKNTYGGPRPGTAQKPGSGSRVSGHCKKRDNIDPL